MDRKKRFLLVCLCFLFFVSGYSQKKELLEKNIPQPVIEILDVKFNVEKVKWEKDGDVYEARFKKNDRKYKVSISEEGKWLETKKDIKKSEIPHKINQLIEKKYGKHKISDADIVITSDTELLEIEIKKNIVFDKEGQLIDEK
ncbi:MAG: PepSY-like domain-containing protein [Vicingus serpentipes]|nr:PepSY-like domain-containing protein [Vicingus serpentipes]